MVYTYIFVEDQKDVGVFVFVFVPVSTATIFSSPPTDNEAPLFKIDLINFPKYLGCQWKD